MKDPAELNGRELDAAVAREIFGRDVAWRREDGERVLMVVDRETPTRCPQYSTDPGAAHAVEEQLERRDLDEAYVDHLLKQERPRLGVVDTLQYRDVWNVVHAGPGRRCRAALAVWRNQRGEGPDPDRGPGPGSEACS